MQLNQRAILDTSVVIADSVAPIPGVLAISAVTLAELHFGVLAAKTSEVRAERLRRLSFLQQHFDALPVDEAVVVSYGRLAAAVVDAGRQPRRRDMDLLIAPPPTLTVPGSTPGTPETSPAPKIRSPSSPFDLSSVDTDFAAQ